MGIVKSDIPAGLTAGVRALFLRSMETAPSHYRKLAMVMPSTKSEEKYAWLSSVPGVREFVDERRAASLQERSFTIENKTWEATIEVERAALEDEQYGQIKLRVQSLAEAAARHKEQMVIDLLARGFTDECYDGEPFFSSTHPAGSATQSNTGASALSASAVQSAISQMAKLTDEEGRPLGVVADTLIVPPDLEWKALELVGSILGPETSLNAINPLRGRLEVIVSPYLTDANNWFVAATKSALKPFILQERTAVEFEALDGQSGSESAFMRDRFYYGVRARYNAGYGLWQLAYGSAVS
ncbi:MAG: Mu-like prophage major head subunit gpT family protein [Armatimonadetes bacterium]|nr:Mu-like prophage major head subunit gpT family protein [Armatimonadota bacterium]